jgi:SAM-dependent methyltransferase
MSDVFDVYADYYDLLYTDKDYAGEAGYVGDLIKRFAPHAKSILELGSGTGRHATLLVERGYTVHGVERSEAMLARAIPLAAKDARLSFSTGDLREVRLGKMFDVVISLFHVISYQTSNQDLRAAFATACEHLKAGGLFIFDCWYGPAVLTEQPSVRVKRIANETIEVTRLVEPLLRPNENMVDVNYQMFIRNKCTGQVTEVRETHHMRYLFAPEIELLLELAGFNIIAVQEWMSGKPLGCNTWGACFVGCLV